MLVLRLKSSLRWFVLLACLPLLTGCQYASFLYKATDSNWANADTSPEAECEALGATRGGALLDWCTAQREADMDREREDLSPRVPPDPQDASSF